MMEQNESEYLRCKEKSLLHRLDLPILKKYGTEEEIKAREPKVEKKEAAKPKPKGKK